MGTVVVVGRSVAVLMIVVLAVGACGGAREEAAPEPVRIAYEYRLEDDRDSVSTELHSAHGDLTPTEFAQAWTTNQIT